MSLSAILLPQNQECRAWTNEPFVSFENDANFYVLEPFFQASDIFNPPLDSYDGGTVDHNRLNDFVVLLKNARDIVSVNNDEWVVKTEKWQQGGRSYSLDHLARKSQVLALIDALISLANEAILTDKKIFFVGD